MWKVKRMNTARIVVLTIAIGAGGIAAYPRERIRASRRARSRAIAHASSPSQPQTWPATTASSNFIDPRGESLSVVRYGVASRQTMQK